jgi:hypothetical protein
MPLPATSPRAVASLGHGGSRVIVSVADLVKVGVEGYIHGWICVRPPCGKVGGIVSHPSHGDGTITAVDDDGVHAKFDDGVEAVLGSEDGSDADAIASRLATHSSFTPNDEEYAKLEDAYDRQVAAWQKMPLGRGGYYDSQKRMLRLYDALHASDKRRELADSKSAAKEAKGKHLDTSALTGGVDDYLPAADATEWRSIVNDSQLKFPSGEDAKADRLDELKYSAAETMLNHAGLPPEAANAIAGWPGSAPMDKYMANDDGSCFPNMVTMTGDWEATGDSATMISTYYDKARSAVRAPEVRAGDFTRSKKTVDIGNGYHASSWYWDDESPEAEKRRNAAGVYWGVRAQQHYTEQVLKELPSGRQSIPVTRMVYGPQAKSLAAASEAGKPWKAATRSLSSWAEPDAKAKASVKRFITRDMGGESPVWVSAQAEPSQVYMHWRGEGSLRNGVKALGEIVVADSHATSANATVKLVS